MRALVYSNIEGLYGEILKRCRSNAKLCDLFNASSLVLHDQYDPSCTYDIVVGDPTMVCSLLNEGLPKLQWFQSTFAGVNAILQNSERSNYILTRIGTGFGPQMVEYVMGWLLTDCISVDRVRSDQSRSCWLPSAYRNKPSLKNKNITILGSGSIGMELAHAAHAMHMSPTLLCTSHTLAQRQQQNPHFAFTSSLTEAIINSHYIINTLPSTPATKYVLSSEILSRCLYSPVFINIGRGDVIAEDQVLLALNSKYISRAILDVFEVEPLPSSSPLWSHPNITVTPHISALSTPAIVAEVFTNNLVKFVDGVQLDFVVDRRRGY